jgi:hypothetical protein
MPTRDDDRDPFLGGACLKRARTLAALGPDAVRALLARRRARLVRLYEMRAPTDLVINELCNVLAAAHAAGEDMAPFVVGALGPATDEERAEAEFSFAMGFDAGDRVIDAAREGVADGHGDDDGTES